MKILATYLPGFHACPFNDRWWGKGFTEWDNVLHSGSTTIRTPIDGIYDLSNPSILANHFHQANTYGIDGFSIYHYWSQGIGPLHRPLATIKSNPNLSIKFSLCWANHSWTRSWRNNAGARDVLWAQTYGGSNDILEHAKYLSTFMADPRYISLDSKPLLHIYRPQDIPSARAYLENLKTAVEDILTRRVHFSGMITDSELNLHIDSLDSCTLFQPSSALCGFQAMPTNISRLRSKIKDIARDESNPIGALIAICLDLKPSNPRYFDIIKIWQVCIEQYSYLSSHTDRPTFPMSFVGFDNTPRYRSRARICQNFDPSLFASSFRTLRHMAEMSNSPLLMINSWNEWGEGMAIEPCSSYGHQILQAIKSSADIC